ncbi:uncharacterized protein LOC124888883 [Capsicum annuum]|uniref:uncharacterized protein LOC124888883 n=1 Tax=Capsicum annuum TaxID=4072 RepID=UPI001FB1210B|nr:uncharacterized protein LOC124888883 [Capsicum annuum]
MSSGKVTNAMVNRNGKSLKNSMEFHNPDRKKDDEQTKEKRLRSNNDEPRPSGIMVEKSKINECQIVLVPLSIILPTFPKWFTPKGENEKFKKIFDKFSTLSINISPIKALPDMLGYAKFVKDLVSKKWLVKDETIEITHHYNAIISSTLAIRKKNLCSFTIQCTIGLFKFLKALFDLRESVKLMPYAIFHKLGLGKLKPTMMKLLMVDWSIKKPMGVLHDVLVKVV